MLASLEKLHLSPSIALTLVIAMFGGGLVNIPIATIRRRSDVRSNPLAVHGLGGLWPKMERNTSQTIIAVNFGGCIVPVGISVYEDCVSCAIRSARAGAGRGWMPREHRDFLFCRQAHRGNRDRHARAAIAPRCHGARPSARTRGCPASCLRDQRRGSIDRGRPSASQGGRGRPNRNGEHWRSGTFDGIVLSGIIAAYLA